MSNVTISNSSLDELNILYQNLISCLEDSQNNNGNYNEDFQNFKEFLKSMKERNGVINLVKNIYKEITEKCIILGDIYGKVDMNGLYESYRDLQKIKNENEKLKENLNEAKEKLEKVKEQKSLLKNETIEMKITIATLNKYNEGLDKKISKLKSGENIKKEKEIITQKSKTKFNFLSKFQKKQDLINQYESLSSELEKEKLESEEKNKKIDFLSNENKLSLQKLDELRVENERIMNEKTEFLEELTKRIDELNNNIKLLENEKKDLNLKVEEIKESKVKTIGNRDSVESRYSGQNDLI